MVDNAISNSKQARVGKRGWLKKGAIPLLTFLLVVAITVGLLLFSLRYPEKVEEFQSYGYLGAFLISLIGNAAVILAVPALPILAALGIALYPITGPVGPILVGLAGGVGAGIGEITGYMAGCSGRGVVERVKLYNRLVGWLGRWGALTIFILSVVPFFFDLVGIAAGVLRFPLWKFILACWLGRTLNYVSLVLLVSVWEWEAVLRYFS